MAIGEAKSERDDLWAVCSRYTRVDRRMQAIRKQIGKLHEEVDALLPDFEADARLIKVAMTTAKTPLLKFGEEFLLMQGSTLRVVTPAYAASLPIPELTPSLPSHDEALEDAKLALDAAIEDSNAAAEADEAAAYCKVRVAS